ncbi:Rrf2 family transcriptional regulator [Patescibacteria group bacterium]|nr:Rrf2 family transcriptional regulator [Patescibacteria group bacterium]
MKQFFEVPARIHNAIIVLCFLAGYKGKYAASLSFISKYLQLSYDFLEQIMPSLKRAGLVKSYRGSAGGYRLAKRPPEISVLDVIEALEGKMQITDCTGGCACKIEKKCPSVNVWKKLQTELSKSLSKIKISEFK